LENAAAPIVQPNSYFKVTRIGSATTSYNWELARNTK
jgi:hypothetical protein